jgi:hypothetical protein
LLRRVVLILNLMKHEGRHARSEQVKRWRETSAGEKRGRKLIALERKEA